MPLEKDRLFVLNHFEAGGRFEHCGDDEVEILVHEGFRVKRIEAPRLIYRKSVKCTVSAQGSVRATAGRTELRREEGNLIHFFKDDTSERLKVDGLPLEDCQAFQENIVNVSRGTSEYRVHLFLPHDCPLPEPGQRLISGDAGRTARAELPRDSTVNSLGERTRYQAGARKSYQHFRRVLNSQGNH